MEKTFYTLDVISIPQPKQQCYSTVRSNMKDMYVPAGTDVRLINSLKRQININNNMLQKAVGQPAYFSIQDHNRKQQCTILRPFVWDYPGEPVPEELVSWSLTSLFSTNMAISETNGHSLQRTPSSPLFSCPGLSPWSSCA